MLLQEAITLLKSRQVQEADYILLDMGLVDDNGIDVVRLLMQALTSSDLPKKLIISLTGTGITDECTRIIAKAIASGKLPEEIKFILKYNISMSDESAYALADAIASEGAPVGLKLVFNQWEHRHSYAPSRVKMNLRIN